MLSAFTFPGYEVNTNRNSMRRFYSLFLSRDFLNKSWHCMTATKPGAKRTGPKEIQMETRKPMFGVMIELDKVQV